MSIPLTDKDKKRIINKAEKLYSQLVLDHGSTNAKWAFTKVLKGLTEKQKLLNEKEKIERRLREIDRTL